MDQNIVNKAWQICNTLFKTPDGKPYDLTYGQCLIFAAIFWQLNPREHIMCYTQYGKSDTIAKAVLARAMFTPEKTAILGPTKDKAQIIMDYLISHIFDNPETTKAFILDPGENLESIRRYRNKRKLTFEVEKANLRKGKKGLYSEIYVQSAKDALGFGAANVIEDESGLIDDQEHALVMRMLGGFQKNFLCKVGNPFLRNHFLKSFRDPDYHKIVVMGQDGVEEGRVSQDYLNEMRKPGSMSPAMYSILYECQFPEADSIDEGGYSALVTERELDMAYVKLDLFGDLRMGIDVASGGDNRTVITVRGENAAFCAKVIHTNDTMSIITEAKEVATQFKVRFDDRHVFIDKIGVGKGLCDRLNELYPNQNFGVNVGAKSYEEVKEGNTPPYINLRAQAYWHLADWLHRGGKLWPKSSFDDLGSIRYKIQSDKRVKIKSKEEMRKDGITSPDVADSLMLTFTLPVQQFHKPFVQGEYQPSTSYGV